MTKIQSSLPHHTALSVKSVTLRGILFATLAMCLAVTASNVLVQYPFHWLGLEHILTYGAFIYPFAFLVNDLTNRRFGPQAARRVVYAGFTAGLAVSWWLASPRLAIASCTAFLLAQLLDIAVFTPLRHRSWWQAPLAAAFAGSVLDTLLFFAIAFAPAFSFIDMLTHAPDQSIALHTQMLFVSMPVWLSLAIGDMGIKILFALFMLLPYRLLLGLIMPPAEKEQQAGT
ncbi:MAG: Hypothetical protein BHV28_01720 [Candidatus Tokpelaia hoelldobleri]|uniref:Probable queuosine precursor transporter n=1 Tax=Candidatus Tokpelaia hoelldobleri TaxID=1902579 RepID=A0A1U9JSQ8_9HYPH|nr:MAG: Hypothetical protein BHV28_01720 [Candidatus Tokpelaia hoelldoblerii]